MNPGFPFLYLLKEVSKETRISKSKRGLCKHWNCRREARKGRSDCSTCDSRKYRIKNRARYVFNQVRESARKRKIGFELTFEEFTEFDRKTSYVEHIGREPDSLTMDRINPAGPYSPDNIRILTHRQNISRIVNNMTDPTEPIARALAKANNGDENRFYIYKKEAAKILEQVEALQQKPEPINEEPF